MENRIKKLATAFFGVLEGMLEKYNKNLVVYNKTIYDKLYCACTPEDCASFEIKGIKDWIFYVFFEVTDYQDDPDSLESWYFYAYFKDNENKLHNKITEKQAYTKNQNIELECRQTVQLGYKVFNIIKFIYEEPELAFCRAYYKWDYNLEYHNKRTAKKKYKAYLNFTEKVANVNQQNDIEMLNIFKDYFKDKYVGTTCLGVNNFPRFMVQVKRSFYGDSVQLGKVYIKKIDNTLYELYTEKLAKCYNRSSKYDTAWKNIFSDYIEIVD